MKFRLIQNMLSSKHDGQNVKFPFQKFTCTVPISANLGRYEGKFILTVVYSDSTWAFSTVCPFWLRFCGSSSAILSIRLYFSFGWLKKKTGDVSKIPAADRGVEPAPIYSPDSQCSGWVGATDVWWVQNRRLKT